MAAVPGLARAPWCEGRRGRGVTPAAAKPRRRQGCGACATAGPSRTRPVDLRRLALIASFALLVGCTTGSAGLQPPIAAPESETEGEAATTTAAWFEAHRHSPGMLRGFIQRMPKGGDLHNHLSGAVYAESYLAWAAA